MLISCPKCVAVYNIAADKIPEQGRRFKCVECGNVWTVYPKDVSDIEPDNKVKAQKILPSQSQEDIEQDVQTMFQRLSRNTDSLFAGTENTAYTKTADSAQDKVTEPIDVAKRKMQVFFSPFLLNGFILCLIALFTVFIGYYHRYEIVRYVPSMENFYNNLSIDSIYSAKNVTFEQLNITPVERGKKHFVEISGRLVNQGPYKAKLPPIKAVLATNDGEILDSQTKLLSIKDLNPRMSSMFFMVLENKTAEAKTIRLSFTSDGR